MIRRFLPLLSAFALALALVGCDAVAPEASSELALAPTAETAAPAASSKASGDTVTGPSTIYPGCGGRFTYSNNEEDFTFWRIKGLNGGAEIISTGTDSKGRPYVNVNGTHAGTIQVRAYNDTAPPFYTYKYVTVSGQSACTAI